MAGQESIWNGPVSAHRKRKPVGWDGSLRYRARVSDMPGHIPVLEMRKRIGFQTIRVATNTLRPFFKGRGVFYLYE